MHSNQNMSSAHALSSAESKPFVFSAKFYFSLAFIVVLLWLIALYCVLQLNTVCYAVMCNNKIEHHDEIAVLILWSSITDINSYFCDNFILFIWNFKSLVHIIMA